MTPVSFKGLSLGSGVPKICVPITGADSNAVIGQAGEIVSSSADIAEWRLDYFNDLEDTAGILSTANRLVEILGDLPLIITLRDRSEGGKRQIADADYLMLYTQIVLRTEVTAIDVEWRREPDIADQLIALGRSHQVRTIISHHEFEHTPTKSEMITQLKKMAQLNGDVVKLAVMPENNDDVLNLMVATHDSSQDISQPIITMAMGSLGAVTRVAGQTFDSVLTFATTSSLSAPGQLTVDQTRQILKIIAH
ncbi:type I 3-dehydroquinate dehydratase [Lactobacillus sp. LC28-10]|uniref:3-dehydroquinate dehydratase n=1 Tax=Secundilactobacillus angelensis TaxID=2722706 RepID=A0ABX1KXN0_9LACO|nr:type I 3-dehydroquinate dehydratase [Secundilactobacillus angelensis]MCH5462967.1 type I 3-dehydroquinate dehydratase [Secundilactobacillus angelensis]NLR18692.1 type I 3-dehydroquinate dehydratase [Secundilactobacillus angelensis]